MRNEFAEAVAGMRELVEHNARTGVGERFERAKREERRQRLIKVAEAGKRGDHGEAAYELAHQYFDLEPSRADLPRLEAYLVDLQRLNIDVHTMPSRRGGGARRFSGE